MSDQLLGIAIHGGAGTLLKSAMTAEKEQAYKDVLDLAVSEGYAILKQGGTSTEAVTEAVIILEDSPLFNAGKGSVFTADGLHEMDAAIMEGEVLNAGAVTLVTQLKNPVALAKKVMEESEHVFLAGKGAEDFARLKELEFVDQAYFYDEFRFNQWQEIAGTDQFQLDHSDKKDHKFGTVGAVALDQFGNTAAATSTGGMTNKRFGRVGDSPMIGAGTYANNATCAVSCTGSGEYFIRQVVAYDVACLIEHKGISLEQAANEVVQERLMKINGDGGLVAINTQGDIAMPFNTEGMYRAYIDKNGQKEVLIYK